VVCGVCVCSVCVCVCVRVRVRVRVCVCVRVYCVRVRHAPAPAPLRAERAKEAVRLCAFIRLLRVPSAKMAYLFARHKPNIA
jgi:hypothetical protein